MKRLVVCFLAFTLAACSTVSGTHRSYDAQTGNLIAEDSITYKRLGDQKINNFSLDKSDDGSLKASVKGQSSDAAALNSAMKAVIDALGAAK